VCGMMKTQKFKTSNLNADVFNLKVKPKNKIKPKKERMRNVPYTIDVTIERLSEKLFDRCDSPREGID
jgi:hypothetical protein